MRHPHLAPLDGQHFGRFVLHEISLPYLVRFRWMTASIPY